MADETLAVGTKNTVSLTFKDLNGAIVLQMVARVTDEEKAKLEKEDGKMLVSFLLATLVHHLKLKTD